MVYCSIEDPNINYTPLPYWWQKTLRTLENMIIRLSTMHNINTAQQSVRWMCRSLRVLQAFLWLQVFSTPNQSSRPPTC